VESAMEGEAGEELAKQTQSNKDGCGREAEKVWL
jgi:hypothetical protein